MKLKNPFSKKTRELYRDVTGCFAPMCGRSDLGLELHHIRGRMSKSKLNACPLCPECHAGMVHNDAEELELLEIVFHYHNQAQNRLTREDMDFIRESIKFYQKIPLWKEMVSK